ncbi:MAG: hypothetical protein ACLU4J_08875 [Butyricimonas paravirosa]
MTTWQNKQMLLATGIYSEIEQSYRLYVFALAGKPNMAAMNRMKEDTYKNPIARWQLAGSLRLGQTRKDCQSVDRQSSGRS